MFTDALCNQQVNRSVHNILAIPRSKQEWALHSVKSSGISCAIGPQGLFTKLG